jgi:hypothetical protein
VGIWALEGTFDFATLFIVAAHAINVNHKCLASHA